MATEKQQFRNEWREKIIQRDKKCVLCGKETELEVHHIQGREYSYTNLITLCAEHHFKIEYASEEVKDAFKFGAYAYVVFLKEER